MSSMTFQLLPEFKNRLQLIGRAGSDAAEWEEIRRANLRRRAQAQEMQSYLDRASAQGRANTPSYNGNSYGAPSFTGGKIGHPLGGVGRHSSKYGWRTHPVHGRQSFHTGTDLAAPRGTPVYATHAGVARNTYDKIYGNRVLLTGGGIQTRYAHLQNSVVKQNQQIKAGQLLGYVGSTGLSTGPHLHFETWIGGKHVNPLSYFMR